MQLKTNYNETFSTSQTMKKEIIRNIDYNSLSRLMKEEYIKCIIIDDVNISSQYGVRIDRNLLAPFAVSLVEDGLSDNILDLLIKMLSQEYNIDSSIKAEIYKSLKNII